MDSKPRYETNTEERAADQQHFQGWIGQGLNKNVMPTPSYVWHAACAYARRTPLPTTPPPPDIFIP